MLVRCKSPSDDWLQTSSLFVLKEKANNGKQEITDEIHSSYAGRAGRVEGAYIDCYRFVEVLAFLTNII